MNVGKREQAHLSHEIFTDFPSLNCDNRLHAYENRNHFYLFSVYDYGRYRFHYKIPLEGNQNLIRAIRKDLKNGTE